MKFFTKLQNKENKLFFDTKYNNNIKYDFFIFKKDFFDDFFIFNKKYNKNNFKKNILKSNYRVDNHDNINKFINMGFKDGKKRNIFKNLNKFNELFFLELKNKSEFNNSYKNIYKLIIEKKFFFNLEYLIIVLIKNYEVMFNVKTKKVIKNLKKLKRKPITNQIIYLKKNKRLNFIFKSIFICLSKSKKYYLFEKINDFFFNDILFYENSLLLKRKNSLYKKLIKFTKKK